MVCIVTGECCGGWVWYEWSCVDKYAAIKFNLGQAQKIANNFAVC